jgi:DNA repair exonuclease SbcCD ATPase subunit
MSSQIDSLAFIKEGSTKRKEILAKFLDLEIFEKKYRMAKDAVADLRGAL